MRAFSHFHLLKAQGIFFFFFCILSQLVTHAVSLSVTSWCVTLKQLWSGLSGWTNSKCECKHSARERGSHSLPKANIFFSYSRVRFSESYLGIILIPTQFLPPKANNSGYHFGQLIKCTAKVWSCLLEHKKPTVADSRYSTWSSDSTVMIGDCIRNPAL